MRYVVYFLLLILISSCTEESIPETLIRVDRNEELCDQGGTKFNLGQDANSNEILEDFEIITDAVFCDDEYDDQVVIGWSESDALNGCNGNGGFKVVLYYDFNKDGNRNGENIDIIVICDGFDINNFLFEVNLVDLGGVCGRGQEVKVGNDTNGNRKLDSMEVEQSAFLLNRSVFEERSPIQYELTINDYDSIAQAYANINPEASENLAKYHSFHLFLWKTEEIDEILYSMVKEKGTKINCQGYHIIYEYYNGDIKTGIVVFTYNAERDDYIRIWS